MPNFHIGENQHLE